MRRRAPEWVPAEALVAVTRLTPSCRKVGTTAAEGALAASSRPCRMAVRDKIDVMVATLVDWAAASSGGEARLQHQQQDREKQQRRHTPSHNGMDQTVHAQPRRGSPRMKRRQQVIQTSPTSEKQMTEKRRGKDNRDTRSQMGSPSTPPPIRVAHCCRTEHKRAADAVRAKPRPACKHRCARPGAEWPSRHGQATNRTSAASRRVQGPRQAPQVCKRTVWRAQRARRGEVRRRRRGSGGVGGNKRVSSNSPATRAQRKMNKEEVSGAGARHTRRLEADKAVHAATDSQAKRAVTAGWYGTPGGGGGRQA